MINIFNYVEKNSPIHRLTGATKLLCFLFWSLAAMITFDTRLLAIMVGLSVIFMLVSKIQFKDIKVLFWFTFVFMVLNNLLIFLFSPEQGVEIYGSRTVIFNIFWRYNVTKEQLFYHLNVTLKYMVSFPVIMLFVTTTYPSEFASSMSKIGISYKVSYAVSLALRYIPDVQREYHDISIAQQARGLEMASKKQSLVKRLKNAVSMVFPLIISSMDKIEIVSNAMDLRGFGKNKKRTWYNERPFKFGDYFAVVFCILFVVAAFILNKINGGRFYNPFV